MNAPAVQITRTSFTYPGEQTPALSQVSLTVQPGQRLGILGPNGGGKSTLLKLILGLLPVQSGTVQVLGMEPAAARRAGLIGYVAQRADLELGAPLSVRQVVQLAAGWRLNPFARVPADVRERVERALAITEALSFAERPIGDLSGGQLQRALIARALACEPKLLVLDEPTVGIDAPGQVQFAKLLSDLHAKLGLTILTVSHDLRAIAAGSDAVACLACRLHFHASPQGLTPRVLAELFSHDIAGIAGVPGSLEGMHIHAHGPGEPCSDPAHPHAHGPMSVTLTTPRGSAGGATSGRAES
jgi:zinc transport system ATP-binding protein